MKLSLRYVLNQFLSTNLSIFFVLFAIVSMVFFIQLAKLTSSIEISFLDLLKLYSFVLPRILIFTLPISFFIALSLTFFRLSRENELIVLFTLGFSPMILAKFFLKISALISALMLVVALIIMPIVLELQENFINYKSTQVRFNYQSGEFGQKFLDWIIFIEKQNGEKYENIIMYHPKKDDKEQLILAKEAIVEKNDDGFSFKLSYGKMYNFDKNESLFIGDFKDLAVNTQFKNTNHEIKKFYEYYSDINENEQKAKEFVIYTAIALFPLASTLFAFCFGFVSYRYERSFIYLGMFGVIACYYGALSVFYKPALLAVFVIFTLSFVSSIICFKKMILNRY